MGAFRRFAPQNNLTLNFITKKGKIEISGDWLNGRALGSGPRGRGFNSLVPDQNFLRCESHTTLTCSHGLRPYLARACMRGMPLEHRVFEPKHSLSKDSSTFSLAGRPRFRVRLMKTGLNHINYVGASTRYRDLLYLNLPRI